ncbi:DNA-3-methyladenine glycosylase I [Chondromyces apiculatus]|nr:DNA-3-methyladenine glycosylase I [Chondromyces apiculatus]
MSDTRSLHRGSWANGDPLMCTYHDEEWGVPERDARALWEKLMLDGFQAGLAWITVLRERETFRAAFAGFEPAKVARFDAATIVRLLDNVGERDMLRGRLRRHCPQRSQILSCFFTHELPKQIRHKRLSFAWSVRNREAMASLCSRRISRRCRLQRSSNT